MKVLFFAIHAFNITIAVLFLINIIKLHWRSNPDR